MNAEKVLINSTIEEQIDNTPKKKSLISQALLYNLEI